MVGGYVGGGLFSGSSVHFQIWKTRLCQMKNSNQIGKNQEKNRGMVLTVLFRVQCTFPNMESKAVQNEK